MHNINCNWQPAEDFLREGSNSLELIITKTVTVVLYY
jgi:hypothetical protein